jgi:ribosomal protein L29
MHPDSDMSDKTGKLVTRGLPALELLDLLKKKRLVLAEETFKIRLGKAEDTSLRNKIKKNIARLMTALSALRREHV